MSDLRRFDPGEDNFRNTWGMTPNADGAWVTYADHAVEVARLREEVARRTEDQVAAEAELYTVRAAALQEVRERIAEFDPESKGFDADEIYVILDEVGNDTHTTQGQQP